MSYLIDIAASQILKVSSFEELVKKVLEHNRFYLLHQKNGSWESVNWYQRLCDFMTFSAHLPSGQAETGKVIHLYRMGLYHPVDETMCPADLRGILRCAVEQHQVMFEYRRPGAWASTRIYICGDDALEHAVEAAKHILELNEVKNE